MAIPLATESTSIDVESIRRQQGALEGETAESFFSIRQFGSGTGAWTTDTRALRQASVGMADDDLWYETDTNLLYRYEGAGWKYAAGEFIGTDAARAAITAAAVDNGARAYATDTKVRWRVNAGAWAAMDVAVAGTANQITVVQALGVSTISLPVSPDVTTSYKVGGNKVVGARGSAIADADGTLADATTKINAILAQMRTDGKIA